MVKLPTPDTASPDTVRAMSLDLFFDYLAMRLNGPKAANAKMTLNVDFGNIGGKYRLDLENGVLNHTANAAAANADATITLSRPTLDSLVLKQTTLDDAVKDGKVTINGDKGKLTELLSYLDNFDFWFNIAEP